MNGGEAMMVGDANEMYPYQKNCLNGLKDNIQGGDNSILKLPTGTGKTRINIENIRDLLEKGQKVIVTAPSRFLINNVWVNELKKWNVGYQKFVLMDGKIPPFLRRKWWQDVKDNGFSVLMTPISLSNDVARGWIDMNYFDVLVMDEGHHSIAQNMYGWRINYNYSFLNDYLKSVIANTINTDCSRLRALKKTLKAKEVTNPGAKTQPVITQNTKITQEPLIQLDKSINKIIVRFASIVEELTGINIDQAHKFFLIEKNIDEIAKERGLSDIEKRQVLIYWAKVAEMMVLKMCLQEDMLFDLQQRLAYFISKKGETKYSIKLMELYKLSKQCKPLKTYAIIEKAKELVKDKKLVLITTKRRLKAEELVKLLNSEGIKAGALMGGLESPQLVLEEYLKEKYQVIVMTPVGIEGLNLFQFNALIHVSPYSSKFTKNQIRGRIRGGDEYYFVYSDTNDEKKLYDKEEVPEFDYLYWHYRQLKREVKSYVLLKGDGQEYSVDSIVYDKKGLKADLVVPCTYRLNKLSDFFGNPSIIGKFGEQVAKAYLVNRKFEVIGVEKYLKQQKLPTKEINFLKSLTRSAIDFLCVKDSKKYLIEIKTTTRHNNNLSDWQKEKFSEGRKFGYNTIKFEIFLDSDKIKIQRRLIQ